MVSGSPAVILDSRTHVLRSKLVGDEYQLDVWLPDGYEDSAENYPVMYVLDSPACFGLVVAAVMTHIWEQLVPELIVVGIGKPMASLDEWWPVRSRDYSPKVLPGEEGSGRSETFLRAVRDEILPFVDSTYRTTVADRTVWGHSLGGVFALRLLFDAAGLFHRYIVTSPAVVLYGQTLLDLDADGPAARAQVPGELFVSVGTLDEDFKPHIDGFTTALRARDYQGLHVHTADLDGYGHLSAGAPGFLSGLRTVFRTGAA